MLKTCEFVEIRLKSLNCKTRSRKMWIILIFNSCELPRDRDMTRKWLITFSSIGFREIDTQFCRI